MNTQTKQQVKDPSIDESKEGRIQRKEDVALIKARLQEAESLVLSDYRGLSVKQIGEVRKKLRTLSSTVHVHKNKLSKIALQDLGYSDKLNEHLKGPTALVFVNGDVAPVIKSLVDFEKVDKYPISVKGSYIDGQAYDQKQTEAISKIPPRDQLLAIFMGTLNAPVQRLASGLQETIAQLARSLKELEKKL